MRLIVALIVTFAFAGLIFVMSEAADGFEVLTDGSRAIFSFRDSNWDAVFGTISLREMNDKLTAVLGNDSDLEQELSATRAELNATRAELNAFKAQQVVGSCLLWYFLMHSRLKLSCVTIR
jgi:hypothetical protein